MTKRRRYEERERVGLRVREGRKGEKERWTQAKEDKGLYSFITFRCYTRLIVYMHVLTIYMLLQSLLIALISLQLTIINLQQKNSLESTNQMLRMKIKQNFASSHQLK